MASFLDCDRQCVDIPIDNTQLLMKPNQEGQRGIARLAYIALLREFLPKLIPRRTVPFPEPLDRIARVVRQFVTSKEFAPSLVFQFHSESPLQGPVIAAHSTASMS